jgi:hypothetical protein
MPGSTAQPGKPGTVTRTWWCKSWNLLGGNSMPVIELALDADGPSILQLMATTSVFTPMELSCVEELWNAYRDKGEASGYTFLAYREDG